MTEEIVQGNTQLAKTDDSAAVFNLLSKETVETIQKYAYAILAAGNNYYPAHIKTQEQAFLTIVAGLEFGLGPIASINQIYVVNGRPTMMGEAQLSLIARSGVGYWEWGTCNDKSATVIAYRRRPDGTWPKEGQSFTYTIEQAQNAGLFRNAVWKQYPGDMLRWKVAVRMARFVFSDIVLGLYEPDEAGVPITVQGDSMMVDVQVLDEEGAAGFPSLGDSRRQLTDAQFEDEPGGGAEIDFEDSGGAGQPLHEPEPDPAEEFRREAQEFVGTILESLLPPEPWPAWADEIPDTIKQLGEKIIGIEPLLKGDPGKALIRLAKQGDHAETWTLIRSWWKDGELPGKLFEALCQAQGVEPEPNPFLSAPEPQDEQDEDAFGDQ